MKRQVVSLVALFAWFSSGFGFPAVMGSAAAVPAADRWLAERAGAHSGVRDSDPLATDLSGEGNHHGLFDRDSFQTWTQSTLVSPDNDYDGLTDAVEQGGWENGAGFFVTDPLDPDSDNDGLTDGQEKLYDTDPLDDYDPGIYVEYEDHLKTRQYSAKVSHFQPWGWQQYADRFISFDAVVVRRGSTFAVGGPADATIRVGKSLSYLTTLTPKRDPCTGRWNIYVPSGGRVGKYTVTLQDGEWSESLDLYVIFELPTPTSRFTQSMINVFLYDDDPDDLRDEMGVQLGDWEYTHANYPSRIPSGEWVNAGSAYRFDLQPFEPFVFEDHVMKAINGYSSQSSAARALIARSDKVTRFNYPRVLHSSWSVLHPGSDDSNQCSNIAGLLTAFVRSAGIPARPFFTDWVHASFDHAVEIWVNGSWYAARGYVRVEPEGCGWNCGYGYRTLQSRYSWGRERYIPWHSGGSGRSSTVMAADQNWRWWATGWTSSTSGHEYRWPSWNWDTIIRYTWFDTLFVPYWSSYGWHQEPQITGYPPYAWPPKHSSSAYAAPAGSTSAQSDVTGYPVDLQVIPSESSIDVPDDGRTGLAVRGTGDYGVDLDGDGYFDHLVVEIELNASQAGTYWIQGQLGVDRWTPYLAGTGGLIAEAVVPADLAEGANTVRFPFDGLRISAAKQDGPYVLKYLAITDVEDPGPDDFINNAVAYESDLYATAIYAVRQFQNWGAALSGQVAERSLDADGDGRYESLTLDVGLDIFEPGTYTIQGDLYDSRERSVAWATWTGSHSRASLQFDGLPGTEGPYTLKEVTLLNADGETIDRMIEAYTTQQVIEAESRTHIVAHADLGELGVQGILPDGYSDFGRDLDGDGLYDLLEIDVPVEIEDAGWYRLEGWLGGEGDALVSWTTSDLISVTVVDTYTFPIAFSGLAIHAHSADGPFTLKALKLLKGDGYQVVDEVGVAYTTSLSYTHDQFERRPYPELPADHVLLFEDRMEDGEGGWMANAPWALTTARSHSPRTAWTDSPGGNYANDIDVSLTTVPIELLEGLSWPTMQLQTCYALEPDYDYGYIEVSADAGITWTRVATVTGSTDQWSLRTVDLGEIGGTEALQVRFRLDTDGGVTALGWYVDDIAVYVDRDLDDDGIPNDVEAGDDPTDPADTDRDGTHDYLDQDSDDDGIPDVIEAGDDPARPVDTDGDGLPDYIDLNSDGDARPDEIEGTGDADGDGIPNYIDPEFIMWLLIVHG